MTGVTLRPNNVWSVSVGATVGGGSGGAAYWQGVADDSDATYVGLTGSEYILYELANLDLPAGAAIRSVGLRARLGAVSVPVSVAGSLEAPDTTAYVSDFLAVNTTTPTTYSYGLTTVAYVSGSAAALTDAMMDSARVRISGFGGAFFRIYAVYVDIVYVTKPTLTVSLPTGTLTDTNLPLVAWSPTFDVDAGSVSFWEVKIFSAAQYGAGGFDPETSAATYGVGVGDTTSEGAATSHQVTTPLANASYRAYVKVGRSNDINAPQYSDWASADFVVNVSLPATPTITVTAESSSGRNKIVLASNAGAATTDALDLERSLDGGTTWSPVRNDNGLSARVNGTSGTFYDYEAPNGVSVTYRARALHNYSGLYAASAWASNSATWSSTAWWLKAPDAPSLNRVVELVTYGDVSRAARQGSFQPLGSSLPIVVSDSRGGATGASTIRTRTTAERDGLLDIATLPSTLLLQGPLLAGEPDRYVRVGDMSVTRLIEKVAKT